MNPMTNDELEAHRQQLREDEQLRQRGKVLPAQPGLTLWFGGASFDDAGQPQFSYHEVPLLGWLFDPHHNSMIPLSTGGTGLWDQADHNLNAYLWIKMPGGAIYDASGDGMWESWNAVAKDAIEWLKRYAKAA
jgi:hypothetical protein